MGHIVSAFRLYVGGKVSICLHAQAVLGALNGNGRDATVQAIEMKDGRVVFSHPPNPIKIDGVDDVSKFLNGLRAKAGEAKKARDFFQSTPRGQVALRADAERERQTRLSHYLSDGL